MKLRRRIMALLPALAMIISMLSTPMVVKAADENALIADQLTAGTLTSSVQSGKFTIAATAEKTVTIDSNSKVAEDGTSFSQRIKLGGSGSADYRSIHFNVTGSANVTVYAMSSSSSEDRKLDLYNLDGTVVDEMEAPGAGLNMKTFAITAGDYYLASPSSGVNVYGVTMAQGGAGFETLTLDASTLTAETLTSTKETNGFQINATAEKKVTIDGNNKVAEDGTSFSQRIKLGGSGNAEYRSIQFTAPGSAKVTVYAMSSSSSEDRKLDLCSLDGTVVGEMDAPGANLNMQVFEVGAGDYYLTSPSSGVNVYGVIVESTGAVEEVQRLDWAEVAAPVITDVQVDGNNMNVLFDLVTGDDGADKAVVTMFDAGNQEIESALVGKSTEVARTATFSPATSGTYIFKVEAYRNGIEEGKTAEVITKEFSLPLVQPVIRAFNNADGSFTVKWEPVDEAESYLVEYREVGATEFNEAATVTTTEAVVSGLAVGTKYELRVSVIRGNDQVASEILQKTLKAEQEREWAFTFFGQSTNEGRNTMEMIDPEAFTFRLNSATFKEDGSIDGKGGKFTTFHDGISYYYTKIDPKTENFELTATFTVDQINPAFDGQEGFGLLAMDSLGEYGVSSVNHYTNSAAVIATKFEDRIDGVKYSAKDTLGARFVSGITPEVLAGGDSAIAQNGKNVSHGFSYAEEDLIQQGKSYTVTLKKTNTGYHSIVNGKEFIMYGVDKLLQLDKENIYVGFAVARGCNATVSDVKFTTSDPANDPPAQPEPAELVSYRALIDSPATTSEKDYEFVYASNVPGTLTVKAAAGNVLVGEAKVTANVDFTKTFQLEKGANHFTVAFTPQADYVPGENQLLESYDTVTTDFAVDYKTYGGSTLYVSQDGTPAGDGSKKAPLDIYTATKFARSGQVIELAGGIYNMSQRLIIARGNDGTEKARKVLKSAEGERAVLNFANADGGMQVWGDYWLIENIDITETPGDVKGLQVAGDHNIISGVNAYKNGDTGIQISGTSYETIEKWPAYNLILNSTSYDNADPGQNNADGFAAKITVGEGNVFRGCIAYNNIDDGWDLFAKIETGPIGAVTIENSIAYANGTLTNGEGDGDGNGFKLGGDGIAVPHKLVNSISFNNNHSGVTSNSNPAAIIENVTSYGNKGANVTLYGKGDAPRSFVAKNVISIGGSDVDNISEMPSLASNSNYFWNGTESVNAAGEKVDGSIFNSTDVTMVPTRDENGSIVMNGLLELNDKAPQGIGAVLQPTVLDIKQATAKTTDSTKASNTADVYVVQEGDNLSKIAKRIFGKARDWKMLYELNKDRIENPDLIFIGQKLKLK